MICTYICKIDPCNLSEGLIDRTVKDVILYNKSIWEVAKCYDLKKSMLHKRVNISKSQCKELTSECSGNVKLEISLNVKTFW